MKVLVKPIGDDVLADLVASGDLAAEIAARVPRFVLGQTILEWTPTTGKHPVDAQTRATVPGLSCVTTAAQYLTLPEVAVSHARCVP